MADLLSGPQRESIRNAIQNVLDTFMKTPVSYQQRGESIDRFQEDRQDQVSINTTFNALVEYEFNDTDRVDRSQEGALDAADVKVTVGLRDIKSLGLVDNNNLHKFTVEQDYFTTNGALYRTELVIYDGPLDQENVLIIIYGSRQERNS